jgi:adenosylcobinamide-GDP ribazoletransferase
MSPALRGVRASFFFLTRIPVGGFPYSDDDWRWATAYFPLVGAFLGLAYAGIWQLVSPAGGFVAATLVVSAGLLFTGCFHEDGLADTADALGGATSKERILEILKDSRIGAFGAAALCLGLVLRVALLARLQEQAVVALVFSQCVARVPPVAMMAALPYATSDETAKSKQVSRARALQAIVAVVLGACVVATLLRFGLSPMGLARGLAMAVVCSVVLALRFHAKVGGVTGDFLGATEQVCECCLLLGLALEP